MSSGGGQSNNGGTEKDKDSQWYFTAEQLANSPSRRQGIDSDQELSYRQMTAYLIQEMGQRLQVSQLCINTAIVYMHRFYAFHSFTHFHRNGIAAASLFLAAKVEEQPRKLEHVIKAANKCLFQPTSSTTDAYYIEQAQDLVFNENVLLQTLGFDVAIDHPHTHVVKTCHLVKACKDLAQTSYFLASNSLHLTSMCLQYKPTVVACFCIYLACKWSRWEIPQSTEGKHWFHYVDKSVTMDLLKQLTDEFIAIYEKSPARLKSKLNSIKALAQGASTRVLNKDKKVPPEEWKMGDMMKMYHSAINTSNEGNSNSNNNNNNNNNSSSNSGASNSSSSTQAISYSMQASSEQQQQQQQSQSVAPALLPPPPPQAQQQQQQQQMRKSEMHSSQHRTHHNSSSHHHTKLPYSSSGDVPDHKPGHKQQAAFSGNMLNRPRDHSQASQSHPVMLPGSTGQPRSNLSSSSGRSLVGSGGMPSQQASQRQSSQSHQLDITYHKSRERSNLLGVAATHGAPSHTGHKLVQKQQESGRITTKDTLSRIPDQVKQETNKLFSSVSSMGNIPQFGGSQMQSGSQSSTKMDQGHDLSRSMLQSQRPYGGNQSQSTVPPPLGYHQTQLSRQGNNSKHDQAKVLSVHMQQQQQHHKQSVPAETNLYGAITHESILQHSHQPHATTVGYANMRSTEAQHVEEHSSSQNPAPHGVMPPIQTQLSQSQVKSASSMFSPDWNEKLQNHNPLMGNNYNGNNVGAVLNDSFGFKMSSSNTKESPRRTDREISIKKEKSRTSHVANENARITVQQQLKPSMPKKLDSVISASGSVSAAASSSNLSELAGTSASGSAGGGVSIKRSSELAAFKQEDDLLRDNKMRKLDNSASLVYIEAKSMSDLNKLQVVNGIETNPDLVRSLLKESLCTTSGLLKPEPLTALSHLPPAELLEPTSTTVTFKGGPDVTAVDKSAMDIDDSVGAKAEKKKKKDKHKHKEKDKSKDRDERKKHKKDKERHKERDREPDNSEHVKIKISKEKLEASSVSGEPPPVGFKIKIPKDRIIGDIHSSGSGHTQGGTSADHPLGSVPPTPALKIKISKDKLENYSSGSAEPMGVSQLSHVSQSSAGYYASLGSHNTMLGASHSGVGGSSSSNSGGSNGKKKDRDRDKEREREKEKKRSAHDFVKSNGSTNASSTAVGISGVMPGHMSANVTLQKPTQNSSKMQQHFTNKVSQLFGESNDDDDDDNNDDYDDVDDDDDDDDDYDEDAADADSSSYASNTLSSSLSSSLMSASQAPTQAQAHAYRQNTEFGMRNTEPPQHLGQHGGQHQIPQR